MSPLITKLGIGAVGLTTAGVGVFYLTSNDSNSKKALNDEQGKTISKLISDKHDYILLNTEGTNDSEAWNSIWNTYKIDNAKKAKGNDAMELDSWTEGNQNDLISELKKKCQELSNSKDEALYEKVTKHCARGVTFAEQAGKENLTILNTETSGTNPDAKIWASRFEKVTTLKNDLDTLKITDQTSADKIKTGCSTAKTNKKQIDSYESVFTSYKKVCTKQPEDATLTQ